MALLTADLRDKLPPLYACEHVADPLVVCKFVLPGTGWIWYAIEFDGQDSFFGYVVGLEPELGYFSLRELEEVRGPFGMKVARYQFEACALSQVRKIHEPDRALA